MSNPEHTPDIAIVIPWRDPGDGERRTNYEYVKAHYEAMNVGAVIIASDGRAPGQPFNRSAAYNRGYRHAGTANVILWNEADTILSEDAVHAAASLALDQPGLVVPYTERHELGPDKTQQVLSGADPFTMRGDRVFPNGGSIGQAGVTSDHTMTLIGGKWDEGFEGWGYDDNAMFHVFNTLAGPPRWIPGNGVHLWHTPVFTKPDPIQTEATRRNHARYAHIKALPADALRAYLAA